MRQTMNKGSCILVIDPNIDLPELECFNELNALSPLPLSLHQPALHGMESLEWQDMDSVKGIIILGSKASVRDRSAWQFALEAWLKPHLEAGIPTFGICYGHQMLAHMFGGTIDAMFADRHERLGMEEVTLDETPWAPMAKGQLFMTHGEIVKTVPDSMSVFARSKSLQTEGLSHRSLPIWSLQSHPEAVPAFMRRQGINRDLALKLDISFGRQILLQFMQFAERS